MRRVGEKMSQCLLHPSASPVLLSLLDMRRSAFACPLWVRCSQICFFDLLFFPLARAEWTAWYIFSLESRLSHPREDDAEWAEDTNGSRATKKADDDSGGPAYIFSISHCKGTQISSFPYTHRCSYWVGDL